MNRLLIIAILIISILPLYAEGQQPNAAKLKVDAQKVVSIISSDTAKFHSYCQIVDLADEIEGTKQEQDSKKAKELMTWRKNSVPNTLRSLPALKASIQIRQTRRKSIQSSKNSTSPVATNSSGSC